MKIYLTLLLFISCSYLHASSRELDQKIDTMRQDQRLVGLGVAVVKDGQIHYLKGFGHENKFRKINFDPSKTMVRWASISKTLVGTIAAMAHEKGLIDLHKDIRHYYPEFSYPTHYYRDGNKKPAILIPLERKIITLKQLLSNTAGIQHYSNGRSNPTPNLIWRNLKMNNKGPSGALRFWMNNPWVALPGDKYSYSTFGFNLAGVVLSKALGFKDISQVVKAWINPVAGSPSLQADYHWVNIPRRSTGYYKTIFNTILPSMSTDVSWKMGGGGFISTTKDMAQICKAHLDLSLMKKSTRNLLWAYSKLNNGKYVGYAMGFSVRRTNGRFMASHGGSQEKARTLMRIYPGDNTCFVAMSNTNHNEVKLGRILDELDRHF